MYRLLLLNFVDSFIDNCILSCVDEPAYGGIVQCRGYRNNVVQNGGEDKPQEIKDFEQKYQRYLDRVFAEKRKERKTA